MAQEQNHEPQNEAKSEADAALQLTKTQSTELKNANTTTLITIFIGLCFTFLCTSLDRAIIATAIPRITSQFHSLDDVGWYGSAFLMTMCAFQLFFGKLYVHLSIKWVFLTSLFIFEVGSVICAAAPNSIALIIGRAVAGVGASGITSGALIIIAKTIPLHQRPMFTGFFGGVLGVAQVVAPTLGGVFTDKLTWRWCFWINLPLGGVTFIIIVLLLKIPAEPKASDEKGYSWVREFDIAGTLLFMPWVISLLLALQWGGSKYAWSSWRMILLLVIFSVFFCLWLFSQWYQGDKATLPLRIMKQRTMAAGSWYMFCMGAAFFIIVYYIPIWFQSVRGESAYHSGINLLATSASMSVTVILGGLIVSRTGYYVPNMIFAVVVGAVGAGLVYTFDRHTSTVYWAAALVIMGVGVGAGIQQPIMGVQTVMQGPDVALASSAIVFIQAMAGTVMLSAAQNTLQSKIIQNVGRVPGVNPQDIITVGASDLHKAAQAKYPSQVNEILDAYNDSLREVFMLCVIFVCLAVFGAASMEWKNVNEKKKQVLQRKKEKEERERIEQESRAEGTEKEATDKEATDKEVTDKEEV